MPKTNHGLNKSRNTSISDNVNPSDLDYELAGAQVTLEDLYAKTKADPEAYEQDADNVLKQAKAIRIARKLINNFTINKKEAEPKPIPIAGDSTVFDLATSLALNNHEVPTEQTATLIAWPAQTIEDVEANLRLLCTFISERRNLETLYKIQDDRTLAEWLCKSMSNMADSLQYCADLLSDLGGGIPTKWTKEGRQ